VLLAKVGKTRVKLGKRQRKLQALEAKIATLERNHGRAAQKESRGQAATNDGHLRHARLILKPRVGADDKKTPNDCQIVGCLRRTWYLGGNRFQKSAKAAREPCQRAVDAGEEW